MHKNRFISDRKLLDGKPVSDTVSEMFFVHVETKYKPLRFAREILAKAGAVTPTTARNWLRREHAPQADSLGALAKNDPEFREKLRKWIEGLE